MTQLDSHKVDVDFLCQITYTLWSIITQDSFAVSQQIYFNNQLEEKKLSIQHRTFLVRRILFFLRDDK
jgi:hypothetical protein